MTATLDPRRALLLAAAACLVAIPLVAGLGGSVAENGLAVFSQLITAGWRPALYLIAAIGLGEVLHPWIKPRAVRIGLGIGVLLSCSHLLGITGLLRFPWVAWVPLAIGAVSFIASLRRLTGAPIHRLWLASIPAAILTFVAACNPPGWLWSSEFGGYDALSYHLALPQEWLSSGRIWPVDHNVYSFLPSYVESAFTHMGALTPSPIGLIAGEGAGLMSCQLLAALLTLLGAWMTAEAARLLAPGRAAAPPIAAVLVISTPWSIVVGSLAYNEMAMLLLFASAACAALSDMPARARWTIAAALVGFACCAKPTALLMCGIPIGVALLAATPRRTWIVGGCLACVAGFATVSPWLVRNWLACGNPVFPFGAAIFPAGAGSTGHWTAEQLARYLGAHQFRGSLIQRLALLVTPDAADPAGPRMRGLLHPQWFALFPATLIAAVIACISASFRRVGALLVAVLLAQLALWLFTTHIQARFLMPLLPVAAALIAYVVSGLGRAGMLAGSAAILTQAVAAFSIFTTERGGHPNQFLAAGPSYRSGEVFRTPVSRMSAADRDRWLAESPPEIFCNFTLPPDATLVLLGNATPLYFTRPVLYSTTWDVSPWFSRSLPKPYWILADFAELSRLQASGWLDSRLAPEKVDAWLKQHATLVRAWPENGSVLVRVDDGAAPTIGP